MTKETPPCLAETTGWACGSASTYNNGPCRGDRCREALAAARRLQRSKAAEKNPKKKATPRRKS